MRSVVKLSIFGIALFVAVAGAFYLALALGSGESLWEPLATLSASIGVMGLLGLARTDAELEQETRNTSPNPDSLA